MAKSKFTFSDIRNGLENLVGNLGTSKDKRTGSKITRKNLTPEELITMYSGDWLTRKIIDIPVDDSTRKWREFRGLEPDQVTLLERAEKVLRVKQTINRGAKRGRLFGGSLVLMGIDGAGELNEPLEVERVKADSLKYLKVIDRQYIKPGPVDVKNPDALNFMRPEFYTLSNKTEIHSSRLLRFDGVDTPDAERAADEYWTTAVPEVLYDAILNVSIMTAATSSLVYESKVDVIQVEDLANTLSTPEGEDLIRTRFALADKVKSLNNILLLDGTETFIRNEYSFAGLEGLLTKFLLIGSSASDIPATRLLGQSAIGFSATGKGDQMNYDNMVRSFQEDRLEPELNKLDEVLLRSVFGSVPETYDFEFAPLEEQNEKEIAETQKIQMETASGYIASGALPPWVVTSKLVEDGTYPSLDEDYVELIRELDEEPPPSDETVVAAASGSNPDQSDRKSVV